MTSRSVLTGPAGPRWSSAPPLSERAGTLSIDGPSTGASPLAAPGVEEWGDFSHHRRVLLPGGHLRLEPDPALDPDPERLAAVATTTARQYFALGYRTIGWKITEGTGYEDLTWRAAYQVAVELGRRFVGYGFARNALSGAAQADYLLDRWEAGAGGRLRPLLDVPCCDEEDTDTPVRARVTVLDFARRAVARRYTYGLVYSGVWYSTPYQVRLDDLPTGWRNGWVSDYNAAHPDDSFALSPGWPREAIVARQFTSTRPGMPGLPMGCDFNRTVGSWPSAGTEGELSAANVDTIMTTLGALQRQVTAVEGAVATMRAAVDRVQAGVDLVYRGDDPATVARNGENTHPENVKDLFVALTDPQQSAVLKALADLHQQLQSGVDPALLAAAIDAAMSSAVGRIALTVTPPLKTAEPGTAGPGEEEKH